MSTVLEVDDLKVCYRKVEALHGVSLRVEEGTIVTVIGLDFGSYLTGSILTETIFSWPGVGRYVLTAIDKRDLPAVQGAILFLSLVFVLVNLVTDLLYAKVDPRVAFD